MFGRSYCDDRIVHPARNDNTFVFDHLGHKCTTRLLHHVFLRRSSLVFRNTIVPNCSQTFASCMKQQVHAGEQIIEVAVEWELLDVFTSGAEAFPNASSYEVFAVWPLPWYTSKLNEIARNVLAYLAWTTYIHDGQNRQSYSCFHRNLSASLVENNSISYVSQLLSGARASTFCHWDQDCYYQQTEETHELDKSIASHWAVHQLIPCVIRWLPVITLSRKKVVNTQLLQE